MKYCFPNVLETNIYYLQQKIYSLFSSHLDQLNLYTLIIILIGGSLTSFNPCLISILPLSLSTLRYSKTYDKSKNALLYGLISSSILMVFIILLCNNIYIRFMPYVKVLPSLLTIVVGLNLLQILKLNMSYLEVLTHFKKLTNEQTINWIVGFSIGTSTSNCSTPILITIVVCLGNSDNIILATVYLLFYLLGYILPLYIFIHTITSINYTKNKTLVVTWNYITLIIGSLMIGSSFFSLLEHINI